MIEACFCISLFAAYAIASIGLFVMLAGACGFGDEDSGLVVLLGLALMVVGASMIFTLSGLMS